MLSPGESGPSSAGFVIGNVLLLYSSHQVQIKAVKHCNYRVYAF